MLQLSCDHIAHLYRAIQVTSQSMLEKFEDKDLSFTDCISFVTMRARGARRAFAFDRHFREAGFVLWPTARN